MATMSPEVPAAILHEIRSIIQTARLMVSVTAGVYFWEWITNFHIEYRLVWRAKLSFLSIIFLLLRYYTFVAFGLLGWVAFWEGDDMEACQRMVLLLPYLPIGIFALANIIVIARVYAMYDKDRRLLGALSILYLTQMAVQSYMPRNVQPQRLPPGIQACAPASAGSAYWVYWTMVILFDTTILGLGLLKLGLLWKANGYMSSTVRVLFRDQIVFYALCFTVNVINITVYYTDQFEGSGKDYLGPVAAGITSMAIARVVLNLRLEGEKDITMISSNRSKNGTGSGADADPFSPTSGNFNGYRGDKGGTGSRGPWSPTAFPPPTFATAPQTPKRASTANTNDLEAQSGLEDLEKQTPDMIQLAEAGIQRQDVFRLKAIPRRS